MNADARNAQTILVVDDEVGIAEALARLLELEGYRAVTAHNGRQGIEVLKHHECDLIITDCTMPLMSGGAFVRAVRADPATAEIPIILASAAADPDPAAREGADAFLRKPFPVERLLRLIPRLLLPPAPEARG